VTLERFFTESGWTEEQLAAAARIDQSTVNRIRRRVRKVSVGLALRIEAATGGRVRADELPMTKGTQQALSVVRMSTGAAQGSAA